MLQNATIHFLTWLAFISLVNSFHLPLYPHFSSELISRNPKTSDIPIEQKWKECHGRGIRYYNDLTTSLKQPDHQDLPTPQTAYNTYTRTEKLNQRIPARGKGTIASLNLETKQGYCLEVLTKPNLQAQDGSTMIFQNYFDVVNGVIIAMNNNRDIDKHEPAENRISWSEAAWERYSQLAKTQQVPITKLKLIVRASISNTDTYRVIGEAYKRSGKILDVSNGWTSWTFEKEKEEFLALLGTTNGAGGAKLLIAHAGRLKKGIVRIRTSFEGKVGPNMVFDLE